MLFTAVVATAMGDMYDVTSAVAAFTAPPACGATGCMKWTAALNASEQALTFFDPSILPSLGAGCAIPGLVLRGAMRNAFAYMSPMEKAAYYGPICPCRSVNASDPSAIEYHTCIAPLFAPEQINLQLANSTTVVVSFVTHELSPPTLEPVARLKLASDPAFTMLSGVSHWYQTSHVNGTTSCNGPDPGPEHPLTCVVRNITMHFIRFPALKPRQKYTYQVRTGGSTRPQAWSAPYTFRAPYGLAAKSGGSNATRVAIYGDMGNTYGNPMGNLRAGCASGAIDAVVHMGDHAYNIGGGDDYHGDAYMEAFQAVLAQCPWLPVIGNHESTMGNGGDRQDASTEQRYLNETAGVIYGQDGAESETSTALSTATTSLGHLLTRSSFYAAGAHGAAPSRTSQWYSVDLGLIHFVILDLDPGPPAVFSGAQAAWCAADLAAADANRANVPWIVVTSHYPLYTSNFYEPDAWGASAAWYDAETAEQERIGDGTPWSATPNFEACTDAASRGENATTKCATVKDVVDEAISSLGALLDQYRVDLYASGHVHHYSSSWPIFAGVVAKQSYVDPHGTVHVVEGNGGVPGAHAHSKLSKCKSMYRAEHLAAGALDLFRMCGLGFNYGRLVTTNASVLTYEHVDNGADKVRDSFSIVKSQTTVQ